MLKDQNQGKDEPVIDKPVRRTNQLEIKPPVSETKTYRSETKRTEEPVNDTCLLNVIKKQRQKSL